MTSMLFATFNYAGFSFLIVTFHLINKTCLSFNYAYLGFHF